MNAWMSAEAGAGDVATLNDCGSEGRRTKANRSPTNDVRSASTSDSDCGADYGPSDLLVTLRDISRAKSPLAV